ncbi:DNA-directed RNA polymerase III subunit RPC2 [Capsicum baccatum]|uniref:DNA-directed RNA polymerase n=1 Tax=Capsicum baccatum TaxID=33114 RepID=A0A2G2VIE1_CAPBA|nr:DNA-directed RNA polymerase III subunit RPC2 [Capsicum baccatum]
MIYEGVTEKLSPQKCQLSNLIYAAPIYVTIDYTTTMKGKKLESMEKDVIIGQMPIMLRSCSCVLYGKDEEQLAKLGECPLDLGGYFVINGMEKVISIQEQLSKNRIIIDTDNKGCVQAYSISTLKKTKSKTIIKMEKRKIYLVLEISPAVWWLSATVSRGCGADSLARLLPEMATIRLVVRGSFTQRWCGQLGQFVADDGNNDEGD